MIGIFLLFIWIGLLETQCMGDPVKVQSNAGHIEGFTDHVNVDGNIKPLTKFLGIPYAEPPTGVNRFKKPISKAPFITTYKATSLPPSCWQFVPVSGNLSEYNEDCLHLSIYVPGKFHNVTSLPVMVWIYGGAFIFGTSNTYLADVLSTFGNVIIITINYRLGAFGFLRSEDGTLPGNQGLWDQHLAIKWVHDNIHDFHGNSNEITIFGESAGSVSVIAQALYPGNHGLFKRVIGQSGSLFGSVHRQPNADSIMNQTGCSLFPDPVNCLRSLPVHEITKLSSQYGPVIDSDFITDLPESLITGKSRASNNTRAVFGDVDLIIGVNKFDGGYQMAYVWPDVLGMHTYANLEINRTQFVETIIPRLVYDIYGKHDSVSDALEKFLIFEYTYWNDPFNVTEIRNKVLELSSDSLFFSPMLKTAQRHSKLGRGSTYVYEFSITPSYHVMNTPTWINGANHADELLYMFGEPLGQLWPSRTNYTNVEKDVSRAMLTLWTNFAKTGNPNQPEDVTRYFGSVWPEFNMTSQSYLNIADRMSIGPIKHRFYPRRMASWLTIIPEIMKTVP